MPANATPEQAKIVCTFTNEPIAGTLIVKKVVVNDNGGTKKATDFSFNVTGPSPSSGVAFIQDGADTLKGKNTLPVSAGTYNVVEANLPDRRLHHDLRELQQRRHRQR